MESAQHQPSEEDEAFLVKHIKRFDTLGVQLRPGGTFYTKLQGETWLLCGLVSRHS
jgi:hypothetical protein